MKKILLSVFLCLSVSMAQAQKEQNDKIEHREEIKIKIKNGAEPDVYIDGKKYDYAIVELLDQSKIKTVEVIKDKQALKEYNAPNGVILIKSVKTSKKMDIEGDPVIYIDGKKANKEQLSQLSPDGIESINVFKGEVAAEKYDAPGGAIIVVTKKK